MIRNGPIFLLLYLLRLLRNEFVHQRGVGLATRGFHHRADDGTPSLGVSAADFRHPVKPGDQVRMEVDIVKIKGKMGKVEGRAYVGDKLCASGEYMFALV